MRIYCRPYNPIVVLSHVKKNKLFRMREGMEPVCGNLS